MKKIPKNLKNLTNKYFDELAISGDSWEFVLHEICHIVSLGKTNQIPDFLNFNFLRGFVSGILDKIADNSKKLDWDEAKTLACEIKFFQNYRLFKLIKNQFHLLNT